MKKHLLFLFFQIKATIRTLPRILLCTVILAVIVAAVGLGGSKLLSENTKSINANVAIVMPRTDLELMMAYDLYTNMESMAAVGTYTIYDSKEEALELMKDGKVAAIAVIPEGFIDGILEASKNKPATLILPANASIESMIFYNIVDAGAKSLAYSQAAIYAVTDVALNHNMGQAVLDDSNEYLNDILIDYAMKRSTFYTSIHISVTGEISVAGYYLASVMVLLTLLCGLSITGIFASDGPAVLDSMKMNRISPTYIKLCRYISAGLVFTLLFLIFTIACSFFKIFNFTWSVSGVLEFILMVFSIVAFIMFMCTIGDNGLVSTLLIFIFSVSMVYACGRIIPSIYLPKTISGIGNFLPVKYWCRLYEAVILGKCDYAAIRYSIYYGLIFLGLSLAIRKRGKQ